MHYAGFIVAVNIPTELLRSFVAIIETGSMLQATERVFVTQSALSLQMRRLEDIVRQPLFTREGRKLRITPAGETLLSTARQILDLNDRLLATLKGQALSGPVRVGFNQDFAEVFLPGLLRDFSATHPDVQMQVRIGGSQELLGLVTAGTLDVAFCVRAGGDPSAIKTGKAEWIGAPGLAEHDVLPLALLEPPCVFRAATLKALEDTGRRYRIVVETASLSGVRAAVQAGLALTCRNPLFIDPERMSILHHPALPAVPDVCFALFTASKQSAAVTHLAGLIRETVTNLL